MTELATETDEHLLKLELRLAQLERIEACQTNFLDFVKAVWPEFIAGEHHRIISEKLERVARGRAEAVDCEYATSSYQE